MTVPSVWWRSAWLLVVAAVVTSLEVSAQRVVLTVPGAAAGLNYGRNIAGIGDVNADGVPDFVVGCQNAPNAIGHSAAGLVVVVSGANGAALYTIPGTVNLQQLGYAVCAPGDVDLDGTPDFAASQPWFGPPLPGGGPTPNPAILIWSGATGALIRQIPGPAGASNFASALAVAGDLDVDGVMDLVAGSYFGSVAHVFSGANGSILLTLPGTVGTSFGRAVAGVGDVNADNLPDVAVSATGAAWNGNASAGVVTVHSGFDGSVLYTYGGANASDLIGSSLAGLGDVTGDGVSDFAIGSGSVDVPPAQNVGSVGIYSGATGALVYSYFGAVGAVGTTNPGDTYGAAVAAAGDVDRDGRPDLLFGGIGVDTAGGQDAGRAFLVSGATGAILGQLDGLAAGDRCGFGLASLGDLDLDGWPEVLVGHPLSDPGGLANAGLIQAAGFGPFLGACGAGSVGPPPAGPFPVLLVNGSTGGVPRRVDATTFAAITVDVLQPPTTAIPANFLLFAELGAPAPGSAFAIGFGIGTMCFPPSVLAPAPGRFLVASSFAFLPGLLPAAPAPWSLALPAGLGAAVQIALQPVIEEGPGVLRTGNAVLLDVR